MKDDSRLLNGSETRVNDTLVLRISLFGLPIELLEADYQMQMQIRISIISVLNFNNFVDTLYTTPMIPV